MSLNARVIVVHGTRRKKGPHAVHIEPDPTLLRTWLFRYCTSRILSPTLPPCCHLSPPLNRPEDEGRGCPRRDSPGDRCAFLRRASYLDLQDIHGVSRTACFTCFHQVVDAIVKCRSPIGAMKLPRTPEELQKLAAEFQASTFIRTHRLFKYVKKNIFRFIPILVRAEQ